MVLSKLKDVGFLRIAVVVLGLFEDDVTVCAEFNFRINCRFKMFRFFQDFGFQNLFEILHCQGSYGNWPKFK